MMKFAIPKGHEIIGVEGSFSKSSFCDDKPDRISSLSFILWAPEYESLSFKDKEIYDARI